MNNERQINACFCRRIKALALSAPACRLLSADNKHNAVFTLVNQPFCLCIRTVKRFVITNLTVEIYILFYFLCVQNVIFSRQTVALVRLRIYQIALALKRLHGFPHSRTAFAKLKRKLLAAYEAILLFAKIGKHIIFKSHSISLFLNIEYRKRFRSAMGRNCTACVCKNEIVENILAVNYASNKGERFG